MHRKQIEVTSGGGIYLGEAFEIEWDFAPVLNTMEFVIRGLWFHLHREALPKRAKVGVKFIEPLQREKSFERFSAFKPTVQFVLGNGVAHVQYFDVTRLTPNDSFWRIVFNFGVVFLAGTGAFASRVKRYADIEEDEDN